MSVVVDNETGLEMHGAGSMVGEGMPRGNKKAGYVGLLLAKHHLGRTPEDYEDGVAKKMARKFNIREMRMKQNPMRPSAYIENIYGDQRTSNVPLTAQQRANLREDANAGDERAIAFLEHIRTIERERQQRSRARRQQGAGRMCGEGYNYDGRNHEKLKGGFIRGYNYVMNHPNPEEIYNYFN